MPYLNHCDVMQVNAFKAIFKTAEGTMEERFATAVAATSDEVFRKLRQANPHLVADYWRQKRQRGPNVGPECEAGN